MKSCLLTTRRKIIIIINTIALTAALRGKVKVRGRIVHCGQKVNSAACFTSFTTNCIYTRALPPAWLPPCCTGLQDRSPGEGICPVGQQPPSCSSHPCLAQKYWGGQGQRVHLCQIHGLLIPEGHQVAFPRTTAFCIPCSSLSGHPSVTPANRLWNTPTPWGTSSDSAGLTRSWWQCQLQCLEKDGLIGTSG